MTKMPLDYPFQQFSIAIHMSAEELDRPQIIRGPWWRELLVRAKVMRPIYGPTLREEMQTMRGREQVALQKMVADAEDRLMAQIKALDTK